MASGHIFSQLYPTEAIGVCYNLDTNI